MFFLSKVLPRIVPGLTIFIIHQIYLLGLYIIVIWVIVIERLWFYIYDISLTHIIHLTPLLTQNLKEMVLWAFILIQYLTLSILSNVGLLTHTWTIPNDLLLWHLHNILFSSDTSHHLDDHHPSSVSPLLDLLMFTPCKPSPNLYYLIRVFIPYCFHTLILTRWKLRQFYSILKELPCMVFSWNLLQ